MGQGLYPAGDAREPVTSSAPQATGIGTLRYVQAAQVGTRFVLNVEERGGQVMYEVKLLGDTDTHRAKTLKQASRQAGGRGAFVARKILRKGKKGPWAKYGHLGAMAHREAVQGCHG